ncbi:MAG: Zn-dependent hydrolase [Gemmatimonadaceae bacterium]|nr:Zn-dependent hydrolase [Gemmatimonadaceae bacterium]
MRVSTFVRLSLLSVFVMACSEKSQPAAEAGSDIQANLGKYHVVKLQADTNALTPNERRMLPLLKEAARAMDEAFWMESYGDRNTLLAGITDSTMKRVVELNYGPWDRLDDNAPFVPGVGLKPASANYYPHDMAKAEFDSAVSAGGARADSLKSLYTIVRRDSARRLYAIPFHVAFASAHQRAAAKLREAAAFADDTGLRRYLELRADALLSDNYQPSDLAWMDMKNNTLDIVIGPIETYEDALYGYKATHEGIVLVKDKQWSARLQKYASMLPALQRGIPVAEEYKRESPATGSDLNAYDIVFAAGDANSGGKSIAINLPNDEEVQLKKGTRRLQLKNGMRAKFDAILVPIARELIAADQLSGVTFDAFFENVMFHEVAHGLGIKNTINNKGPVRTALKERSSALEEGKADILGLYMIRQLNAAGELGQENLDNNYITFVASLFRSVRFGAADAHGRANVVAFNFLEKMGAWTREADGKYRINTAKVREGADALSQKILLIQGNGDYEGAAALAAELGKIGPVLQGDLDRLKSKSIPVDIIYDQN